MQDRIAELEAQVSRLRGIIEFAHKELHSYLNNYSTMEEVNESSWAVPIYTKLGQGLGNLPSPPTSNIKTSVCERERIARELLKLVPDTITMSRAAEISGMNIMDMRELARKEAKGE